MFDNNVNKSIPAEANHYVASTGKSKHISMQLNIEGSDLSTGIKSTQRRTDSDVGFPLYSEATIDEAKFPTSSRMHTLECYCKETTVLKSPHTCAEFKYC